MLFDPENLCGQLSKLAAPILAAWHISAEELERLRNDLAIQQEKTMGFREKNMPLHLRFYANGIVYQVCDFLVRIWDGYAVDGGKNLTRVLENPECPQAIKESLRTLLTGTDLDEMADTAVNLCRLILEETGGPVNSYHGGIPR